MRRFLLSLFLTAVSASLTFAMQTAQLYVLTPNVQQGAAVRRLDLQQLKELIAVKTSERRNAIAKDRAIAAAINRSGINFEVTTPILQELRALGAGPSTLAALEKIASQFLSTQSGSKERTRILVAEFEGPMLEGASVAEVILDELNDRARDYADIDVVPLRETISARQGRKWALERGKELDANIVIWGWYKKNEQEVLVNVHFQLVDDTSNLLLKSEKQSTILPISDFFKFQVRLSKEMGYLTFFAVGIARLVAGDLGGARNLLSAAIRQSTAPEQIINPASAYLARATINLLQGVLGNLSVSAATYDDLASAIHFDDKNAAAYSMRCGARSIEERFDLALPDCTRAIQLDPESAVAYATRSWVLEQQGDARGSLEDLEKASQLSRAQGNEELTLWYEGALFSKKNNPDGAITAFTGLMERNNHAYITYLASIMRGQSHLQKRNYDLALKDFRRALELFPNSGMAHWSLGDAQYDMNDYTAAVASYNKAIELGVTSAEIYVDLADAYDIQDKTEPALENYAKAIALDPKSVRALRNRAITFFRLNRLDDAITDLSAAITLDPKSDLAVFYRGRAYAAKEQLDLAISDFGAAIKLNPNDARYYYQRAFNLEGKGDQEAALKDYDSAIALDPKNENAHIARGYIHLERRNNALAEKDFDAVVALNPNNPFAYMGRALTLVQLANNPAAVSDLNKVLELTSDNDPLLTRVRQRAKRLLTSLMPK
jgi:tetratricopeptide (TPR) repeat protein